jgi:HK97 gp10 family phage protein
MANVSISASDIKAVIQELEKWGKKLGDGMEDPTKRGMEIIAKKAKNKIHNISGETAASIKTKIDGKGKNYVVGHIGTIGGTKEEAIRANSLEFGHAYPRKGRDSLGKREWTSNREGGEGNVKAYPFVRPALKGSRRVVTAEYEKEVRKILGGDSGGD